MVTGLPPRLSRKEIALVWKVTPARVGQIIKSGRLNPDEDGLFDADEVVAFRKAQIKQHEINTLFKSYNEHPMPKIIDHLSDDDGEIDPLDCTPSVPKAQTKADVVNEAAKRVSLLSELKAEEVRQRLRRTDMKMQKEAGELVERTEVHRVGIIIGQEITNMLRALEVEIPSRFADKETRSEVRQHVSRVIERCQHTIHSRLQSINVGLDGPDDDEEDDV